MFEQQQIILESVPAIRELVSRYQWQPEAGKSVQLKARTGTETQPGSYEVSTSSWYKPLTWGETKTVHP